MHVAEGGANVASLALVSQYIHCFLQEMRSRPHIHMTLVCA